MRAFFLFTVLLVGSLHLRASEYFTVICRDLYFTSSSTGWIIGGQGLYRTKDGGQSWALLNHSFAGLLRNSASPRLFSGIFLDDLHGWIAPGYVAGNQVLRTRDGAKTWEDVTPDFPETEQRGHVIRLLRFIDVDNGWLVIERFIVTGASIDTLAKVGPALLMKTEDGGDTWVGWDLPWHVIDMEFEDPRLGWALTSEQGDRLSLLRTQDGGRSWQLAVSSAARPDFAGVGQLMAAEQGKVHAFNRGRGELYSIDMDGDIELTLRADSVLIRDIHFHNGAGSFVADSPPNGETVAEWMHSQISGRSDAVRQLVISRSDDGGISWSSPEPVAWRGIGMFPVKIRFYDADRGWIVLHARATLESREQRFAVLRTLDGGKNWETVFGPWLNQQ